MEIQKLGISNIKSSMDDLLLLILTIVKVARDRDLSQLIVLTRLVLSYKQIVERAKLAVKEIADLDQAESIEVSNYFKVEFDLDDDRLEADIEDVVAMLPRGFSLAAKLKETANTIQEAYKTGGTWREIGTNVVNNVNGVWASFLEGEKFVADLYKEFGDVFKSEESMPNEKADAIIAKIVNKRMPLLAA